MFDINISSVDKSMNQKDVQLSFCNIKKLDDFVIELTVNPDIELGFDELREFHGFLDELKTSIGLLVNRENVYSYAFGVLDRITSNENLSAAAILVEDESKISHSKYIISALTDKKPVQLFGERHAAMTWLEQYRSA